MHFLLWTKGSYENTNFDTFKCSDENLQNSSCHFPKPPVSFSSNFAWLFSVLKYNSSVLLYTLHKRDQSNCKFLRLFSARIKFRQIFVIFETKDKFIFKFCTRLCYHETCFLHTFLAETLYTFSKSSLSKYKFGEIAPEQSKSEILHCGGILL